jgi:hypothetical protein
MSDTATLPALVGEKLISFAQAARLIPPSRQDRPVSPSCIWRWHRVGVTTTDGRRVKLEAVWLVNRLVTSEQAVQRFIAALQPTNAPPPDTADSRSVLRTRHDSRRQRDSEKALRELQEMRKG